MVSAITSRGPTDTKKSITSEAPTDVTFYYQWRSNFSLKTFTRGRKQYAHYETPEKHVMAGVKAQPPLQTAPPTFHNLTARRITGTNPYY